MRLPEEVRKDALKYVYSFFDLRRWEQVSSNERTVIYDELILDKDCGGILRPYMTEAQIRVWLKDTAAKEYSRALEGIGATAPFTNRRYPGPDALVRAAFGADWTVVPGSSHRKPMGCTASGPNDTTVTVFWGTYRVLRDLYWAASRVRALTSARTAIIVTRPSMTLPAPDEWHEAEALSNLIGAEIFSVMYAPQVIKN